MRPLEPAMPAAGRPGELSLRCGGMLKGTMKKHHPAPSGSTPGSASTFSRTTERFTAEGLDCPSCGVEVRDGLRQLHGIFAVAVNVPAQEIAVTYDAGRVAPEQIRSRLAEIGFGCN